MMTIMTRNSLRCKTAKKGTKNSPVSQRLSLYPCRQALTVRIILCRDERYICIIIRLKETEPLFALAKSVNDKFLDLSEKCGSVACMSLKVDRLREIQAENTHN